MATTAPDGDLNVTTKHSRRRRMSSSSASSCAAAGQYSFTSSGDGTKVDPKPSSSIATADTPPDIGMEVDPTSCVNGVLTENVMHPPLPLSASLEGSARSEGMRQLTQGPQPSAITSNVERPWIIEFDSSSSSSSCSSSSDEDARMAPDLVSESASLSSNDSKIRSIYAKSAQSPRRRSKWFTRRSASSIPDRPSRYSGGKSQRRHTTDALVDPKASDFPLPMKQQQSELLVLVMLDKLCSAIEPDQTRKSKVFFIMYQELVRIGMLPSRTLPSNASYRLFESAFYGLMSRAWTAMSMDEGTNVNQALIVENALAIVPLRPSSRPSSPMRQLATIKSWQTVAAPQTLKQSKCANDMDTTRMSYFLRPSRYEDEFRELEMIGRGGFGRVVKAEHKLDGIQYAVKKILLKQELAHMGQKVLREVTTLAPLDHPNVIRYNAAWLEWTSSVTFERSEAGSKSFMSDDESSNGEKDGDGLGLLGITPTSSVSDSVASTKLHRQHDSKSPDTPKAAMTLFIQMQLMELTLHDWIQERVNTSQPVIIAAVSEIFKQLLRGVAYIHAQGLIHRDIKPRNIFLNKHTNATSMQVKLGDFGLATEVFEEEQSATWFSTDFTYADLVSPTATASGSDRFARNPHDDARMPNNTGIVASKTYVAEDGSCGTSEEACGTTHVENMNNSITGASVNSSVSSFGKCAKSSKECGSECNENFAPSRKLSRVSSFTSGVGTSSYASPEQLESPVYSARSDIYSLGIVLFELLSNFKTGMERAVEINAARKGQLPRDICIKFPVESAHILWLTAHDPDKRPDAADILARYSYELELEAAGVEQGGQGDMIRMLTKRLCETNEQNARLRNELMDLKQRLACCTCTALDSNIGQDEQETQNVDQPQAPL